MVNNNGIMLGINSARVNDDTCSNIVKANKGACNTSFHSAKRLAVINFQWTTGFVELLNL